MQQQAVTPYADRIIRRNGEVWHRSGQIPAWAQHRLDMIDAVSWFQTAQSGVHLSKKDDPQGFYTQGMLMGGHAVSGSYIDAEVVITSLNGSNEDQTKPTINRNEATRNTIRDKYLVGMIFETGAMKVQANAGVTRDRDGTGAQLLPCDDMPKDQNCWVADWFLPTHIWPTTLPHRPKKGQSAGVGRVWMVRFEKFALSQRSWWANSDHGEPPQDNERDYTVTIPQERCDTCNEQSPRIFEQYFVCLQENCSNLWKHNGNLIAPDEHPTYTNAFLQHRTQRPLAVANYPTGHATLVADFNTWWDQHYDGPRTRNEPINQSNYIERMRDLLRGFPCPNCGMLNRRFKWWEWSCRNIACSYRKDGAPMLMSVAQAKMIGNSGEQAPDFTQHIHYRRTQDLPDHVAIEFEIGEECSIAYLKPKPQTNAMPGSSDDLYRDVQTLAASGSIPLKRRAMNTRAGATLTSHFAANYGEQYIFTARVPSIPFADAPNPIQNALRLTNNWVGRYRPNNELPANEMYLAAYMQGQKMNWHDDGEVGLGEVITTYTLGGQGEFKLSIKPRYDGGGLGNNTLQYDPVIPGCEKEDQRKELQRRLRSKEINQAQFVTELKNLMRGYKPKVKTVLTLPVSHGDIVIMYGRNTQKYFRHCVDVHTPMRFALTFRYISPEHTSGIDMEEYTRKLAYDVVYDASKPFDEPQFLDPVNDEEGPDGEPLPAGSPRDDPPEADGDNDDNIPAIDLAAASAAVGPAAAVAATSGPSRGRGARGGRGRRRAGGTTAGRGASGNRAGRARANAGNQGSSRAASTSQNASADLGGSVTSSGAAGVIRRSGRLTQNRPGDPY